MQGVRWGIGPLRTESKGRKLKGEVPRRSRDTQIETKGQPNVNRKRKTGQGGADEKKKKNPKGQTKTTKKKKKKKKKKNTNRRTSQQKKLKGRGGGKKSHKGKGYRNRTEER